MFAYVLTLYIYVCISVCAYKCECGPQGWTEICWQHLVVQFSLRACSFDLFDGFMSVKTWRLYRHFYSDISILIVIVIRRCLTPYVFNIFSQPQGILLGLPVNLILPHKKWYIHTYVHVYRYFEYTHVCIWIHAGAAIYVIAKYTWKHQLPLDYD